jgi:cobalamin biosynthetic protein CobC
LLEHGGRLLQAAARFGIPRDRWLDLSTGLNPQAYPLPAVPAEAWARLPEREDGLSEVAAGYYGSKHLLPVAGSQAAIQALPRLRPAGVVGVLVPSYAEHAHAWSRAGHRVIPVTGAGLAAQLPSLDVLIVVNPNNPTGERFDPRRLLDWHAQMSAGGWLVVDEAFLDAEPSLSLARRAGVPGLIVLRSLGKFFGLAGARAGFVLAWPALLRELEDMLGPWSLAGPARFAARQALSDTLWQRQMRAQLPGQSERLAALLEARGLEVSGRTALFVWCRSERAPAIYRALARRAILIRQFTEPASLRLGLPATEADWLRLEQALEELSREGII